MTFGFSRDDVEGRMMSAYLELGLLARNPFEVVDADGVGELIRLAVERGRAARPDLKIGVCGEHGGDPTSIGTFYDAGLDYVSCSPFRVPVARLAAAQAVLGGRATRTGHRGRRRRAAAGPAKKAAASRGRQGAAGQAVPNGRGQGAEGDDREDDRRTSGDGEAAPRRPPRRRTAARGARVPSRLAIPDEEVAQVRAATDIVALIGEHVGAAPAGPPVGRPVPVPRREDPVVQRERRGGPLLLLRLPGLGRRHQLRAGDRALDFADAVRHLAERAGIVLHERPAAGHRPPWRTELLDAMEQAVAWYHERLLSSPDAGAARDYLRSRGYDGAVVRQFRLGWAPDDWDALSRALGSPSAC